VRGYADGYAIGVLKPLIQDWRLHCKTPHHHLWRTMEAIICCNETAPNGVLRLLITLADDSADLHLLGRHGMC
jgi:hypothetical protein